MSFASVIFALVPPPVLAVSLSNKSVTFTEELTLLTHKIPNTTQVALEGTVYTVVGVLLALDISAFVIVLNVFAISTQSYT